MVFRRLALRVPEDDVAAILILDRGEVRIDFARADHRVCEGERDIFAARRLRGADPAAANIGAFLSGIDPEIGLFVGGLFVIF